MLPVPELIFPKPSHSGTFRRIFAGMLNLIVLVVKALSGPEKGKSGSWSAESIWLNLWFRKDMSLTKANTGYL